MPFPIITWDPLRRKITHPCCSKIRTSALPESGIALSYVLQMVLWVFINVSLIKRVGFFLGQRSGSLKPYNWGTTSWVSLLNIGKGWESLTFPKDTNYIWYSQSVFPDGKERPNDRSHGDPMVHNHSGMLIANITEGAASRRLLMRLLARVYGCRTAGG